MYVLCEFVYALTLVMVSIYQTCHTQTYVQRGVCVIGVQLQLVWPKTTSATSSKSTYSWFKSHMFSALELKVVRVPRYFHKLESEILISLDVDILEVIVP